MGGNGKGIVFTANVAVPSGCSGTFEWLQLACKCKASTYRGETSYKRMTASALDNTDPYASEAATSGAQTLKTEDSPETQVDGRDFEGTHIADKYQMYLLWRPASGARIGLGRLSWKWDFRASQPRGSWTYDEETSGVTETTRSGVSVPSWTDTLKNYVAWPTEKRGEGDCPNGCGE
jgi:hypothetical protein